MSTFLKGNLLLPPSPPYDLSIQAMQRHRVKEGGAWMVPNPAFGAWKGPAKPHAGFALDLPCTLVLTSVTLLGQWSDEVKKKKNEPK